MFTGIIKEIGTVEFLKQHPFGAKLKIKTIQSWLDAHIGDSICVNGCCLTIMEIEKDSLSFDVVTESLNKTSLGSLKTGSLVNIETALRSQDRFGGHYVQGHVDAIGIISESHRNDDLSAFLTVTVPGNLMKYIVYKGSITLDGVSLTVASKNLDSFSIALIPHTAKHTNLGTKLAGDPVNIEIDIIAKYLEQLTQNYAHSSLKQ